MIILSSNGLTSKKVADKFKKYINKMNKKNVKAVFITTAGVKETDECIPLCRKAYDELDIHIDFIDINTNDLEKLREYDIVEFMGGNPFLLLHNINVKSIYGLLEEHLEKGRILSGWSAGAFVLQNSISLAKKLTPGMNDKVGLKDFTGLNFVDFEIMPHYQWLSKQIPNLDGILSEYEKESGYHVYKLCDGSAVFVDSDGTPEVVEG